ncbi:hypothetical protein CPT_Suzuki_006 [Stenotrophomonas phage Suzuki]|nr:hypothetical protein CPT_Suzuki_006 [Stenotrophomonas phage Suzuki]
MITFSLVLVLILGGERHTFVMDTGLTAGDCVQALADNPHAPLRCEKE